MEDTAVAKVWEKYLFIWILQSSVKECSSKTITVISHATKCGQNFTMQTSAKDGMRTLYKPDSEEAKAPTIDNWEGMGIPKRSLFLLYLLPVQSFWVMYMYVQKGWSFHHDDMSLFLSFCPLPLTCPPPNVTAYLISCC